MYTEIYKCLLSYWEMEIEESDKNIENNKTCWYSNKPSIMSTIKILLDQFLDDEKQQALTSDNKTQQTIM